MNKEIIKVGDKVKYSKYGLEVVEFKKDFYAKFVFEVKKVEVSQLQGKRYILNTGTFLWENQCVKVSKDTPLFH